MDEIRVDAHAGAGVRPDPEHRCDLAGKLRRGCDAVVLRRHRVKTVEVELPQVGVLPLFQRLIRPRQRFESREGCSTAFGDAFRLSRAL